MERANVLIAPRACLRLTCRARNFSAPLSGLRANSFVTMDDKAANRRLCHWVPLLFGTQHVDQLARFSRLLAHGRVPRTSSFRSTCPHQRAAGSNGDVQNDA